MHFSARYWSFSFFLLVVSAAPLFAQGQVRLRLAHNGNFLPAQTQIIIIDKPGELDDNGRYQPEFIANDNFPIALSSVVNRDELDASGTSLTSYPRTDQGGRLYFIYALTPDSVFYWSYSARMAQPKYDVVEKGVMSVAPIGARETQIIVREVFYDPPSTTRAEVLASPVTPQPEGAAAQPLGSETPSLTEPTPADSSPAAASTGFQFPLWLQIALPLVLGGIIVLLLLRVGQLKAQLSESKASLAQTRQQIHLYATLPTSPKKERIAEEPLHVEEPSPPQHEPEPEPPSASASLTEDVSEHEEVTAPLDHPENEPDETKAEKEQDDFPLIPPPPISEEVLRAQREKKNQPPPEIVIVPDEDEDLGHPEAANDTLILDDVIASDIPELEELAAEIESAPENVDIPPDHEETADENDDEPTRSELMSRYQALMRDLDVYRSTADSGEAIADPSTPEAADEKS